MNTAEAIRAIIASEPVVDKATTDRYAKRGPNLIKALVDAFLGEAQGHLKEIRDPGNQANFVRVRSAAHGLKSCSFNLGAFRLAKICQETEHAAAAGDQKAVAEAIGQIGPALFDAEEALKGLRLRAAGAPAQAPQRTFGGAR